MNDLRKRFAENAEVVALMTEMLAENERLNGVLASRIESDTAIRAENLKLLTRLCKYEGHLPIHDAQGRAWCELCESEIGSFRGTT